MCGVIFVFIISCNSLMNAVYKNKTKEVVELLNEGADVNKGIGGGPLVTAAANNNVEIVRILIEHGADVNQSTTNNWTPLHFAAKNNNPEILKMLIDKGANVNVVNKMGESPLKIAEERGYTLIVRLLNDTEERLYNNFADNNQNIVTDKSTTVEISDVDVDIPINNINKPNTYALIIGNEDYSSFQTGLNTEINVDFAINDAKIFKEYCNKTLGIPEKQIKLLINATFGQMNQGIAWLNNLAKIDDGNAELILYYSGHGLPDEQTKESYIMPVDISGNNVSQAIKLTDVYNKLLEHPSKRVTVFLDACFSGGARNQSLIAAKGVRIEPKKNILTGNIIVISSSTGDESSGVFREEQHGFMTYFLLKKLQESKGNVSYQLDDKIIDH